MMKRVYIAGKLNANAVNYIKNLHDMCHHAEAVRQQGYSVFVPGIDFLMGFIHGTWDYKDYFNNSQPWLLASDAIFVSPNSEESKGTALEVEAAREAGIPVAYSIPELNGLFPD